MVVAQIATSVGGLDNHFLASHSARRKRQLVARAAPARFTGASNVNRSKTVGQAVVNGPWLVAIACIGRYVEKWNLSEFVLYATRFFCGTSILSFLLPPIAAF